MKHSHTLLLVCMLSFGGFMVSKLVHGMVRPGSEVREVQERMSRPVSDPIPARAPSTSKEPGDPVNEPPPRCVLSEQAFERNVTGEGATNELSPFNATKAESSLCCCDVRRPRLHII